MFLKYYISEFNYQLIEENYDRDFLSSLDEELFKENLNIFNKYKISCIEDIILNYLDIFTFDSNILDSRLIKLITKLGNNYNEVINNNLSVINDLYTE
jgi:hypothetical protein